MAVSAAAAVAAGAFAVPYLLSLGSSTSARTAGQAAAAAAGRGMTSLSMTQDRTVNAAGLPSSVRAAGNRYWTRHAAAASHPKKPAPARPTHAAQPAQAADRSGQPTAKGGSSSGASSRPW
jgi:isopentenyl diphosphate isomerase/L-lactate dehydrogenase-like FMN-dependent dehydrogenase